MEIANDGTGARASRTASRRVISLLGRWNVVLGIADAIALAAIAIVGRDVPYPLLGMFLLVVPVLFVWAGLYPSQLRFSALDQAPAAIFAITFSLMTMITVNYLWLGLPLEPETALRLWVAAIVLIPISRIAAAPLRRVAVMAGPKRPALIVGSGHTATLMAEKIERHPELGLDVVGFVDDGPRLSVRGRGEPLLGPLSALTDVISSSGAQVVVMAFVKNSYEQILSALYRAEPKVEVLIMPRYFEFLSAGIRVDDLAGIPLLHMHRRVHSKAQTAFKRGEDIVLSGMLLLVVLPFLPFVALAIKLDSPGPLLYKSRRMGKDFKPFDLYKFRSMHSGADHDDKTEEQLRAENPLGRKGNVRDPRVTRVGHWLRRTSIDELPQLYNVLAGDMSLVGPRPLHPDETAAYEEWQKKTLSVRPGLTCLWQVSGRSDLPFDEKTWLDFMYIDTWSPWLDFRILLETVTAVLSMRGAY